MQPDKWYTKISIWFEQHFCRHIYARNYFTLQDSKWEICVKCSKARKIKEE